MTQAAQELGFAAPLESQIALAVDEAIGNVIKHGYDGRPDQPIEVAIESVRHGERRGLQITVCDCGRQVDPGTIIGRDLEEVRPGGLGTHIIRKVMDEVEYSLRQPQGMQLRMVKLLDTVQAEQGSKPEPRKDSPNGT